MTSVQSGLAPVRPVPPRTSLEILSTLPPVKQALPIRPAIDRVIRDIVREVRRAVPAYAQPQESDVSRVLVGSVERAAHQLVEAIGNPDADRAEWEKWFRNIGRLEYHEGRSMDALQTAVRVGARVGWRHIQATGTAAGMPASALFTMAEALFQYADDLSAVAIAGHAEAKARANGDLHQRRIRLLKLIVADPPIAPQAILEQAALSDWDVPERIAVVALERGEGQRELSSAELGRGVLADVASAEPCLVVPEPDRRLARVERAVSGWVAAVGPTVTLTEAPRSLDCARRVLGLARRGVLTNRRVLRCSEHLPTLAMYADEFVLEQVRAHALRPFAELTSKQRERLSETLAAWLHTRGGINEVADRLGVHPQTVRYRMNQVSELLGDRLDDPDERLMLEMALRTSMP